MSLQARSARYITHDSLNIRHLWWVHMREEVIIWRTFYNATSPRWWLMISDNIYFGIQDTWLLLIIIITDHSWDNVGHCGSSECSLCNGFSEDSGLFDALDVLRLEAFAISFFFKPISLISLVLSIAPFKFCFPWKIFFFNSFR